MDSEGVQVLSLSLKCFLLETWAALVEKGLLKPLLGSTKYFLLEHWDVTVVVAPNLARWGPKCLFLEI